MHPTVKQLFGLAGQLAKQQQEEEDVAREKLNSHVTRELGTAADERKRRARDKRLHRVGSCSNELDDWLAQAEVERRSWNLWGAPEEYPLQVAHRHDRVMLAKRQEEDAGKENRHGGGTTRDTSASWAHDVWSASAASRREEDRPRKSLDANMLFCPDTRFSCFVQEFTQRA